MIFIILGVVVYGYEYFYGGGIQSAPPGMTAAGRPTQVFSLGYTKKTMAEFHAFLQSEAGNYTPDKYSLLKHNCNNFASHCVRFLLDGHDIPSFITGLPEEALNTPMGAMFRPMIEGMESQMRAGGANGGLVPWGDSPLSLPAPSNSAPRICLPAPVTVQKYLVSDAKSGSNASSSSSSSTPSLSLQSQSYSQTQTQTQARPMTQIPATQSHVSMMKPPVASLATPDFSMVLSSDSKQSTYAALLRAALKSPQILQNPERRLSDGQNSGILAYLSAFKTQSPASAGASSFDIDMDEIELEEAMDALHSMILCWDTSSSAMYAVCGVYGIALTLPSVKEFFASRMSNNEEHPSFFEETMLVARQLLTIAAQAEKKDAYASSSTAKHTALAALTNFIALPVIYKLFTGLPAVPSTQRADLESFVVPTSEIVPKATAISELLLDIVPIAQECLSSSRDFLRVLATQILVNIVTIFRLLGSTTCSTANGGSVGEERKSASVDIEDFLAENSSIETILTELLLLFSSQISEETSSLVISWMLTGLVRILWCNQTGAILASDLEIIPGLEEIQRKNSLDTVAGKDVSSLCSVVRSIIVNVGDM